MWDHAPMLRPSPAGVGELTAELCDHTEGGRPALDDELAWIRGARPVEAWLEQLLCEPVDWSVARAESAVEALLGEGLGRGPIGSRVHDLVGLLDLLTEVADADTPERDRFAALATALMPLCTTFPRPRRLVATRVERSTG